jgi:hypothetical protein
VRAADAAPGHYRTPRGRLVEVVARATTAWPAPPAGSSGWVPYHAPLDPAGPWGAEYRVRGWLPPDYPLEPAEVPAEAVAAAEAAAAVRAEAASRLAEHAPAAREGRRRAALGRLPPVGTVLRRIGRDGRSVEARVVDGGVEVLGRVYGSMSAATTAAAESVGMKRSNNFWKEVTP